MLTPTAPDSKFDLPPDDYVAIASIDLAVVEQPFSVKAGELQDVKVDAQCRRAGDHRARRFEDRGFSRRRRTSRATARRGVGYDQNPGHAAGGDYVDRLRKAGQGSTKEGTATVKAGERTELTVQ